MKRKPTTVEKKKTAAMGKTISKQRQKKEGERISASCVEWRAWRRGEKKRGDFKNK